MSWAAEVWVINKDKETIRQSQLSFCIDIWVKVKQTHYRSWQALRFPGGWGSQISRQSAYEGGKVVSPTHRPSLPPTPRKYSWYSFLLQTESTPEPEGLCLWKITITPSGIEPATFWLVAQCLNQLRHSVIDMWEIFQDMFRSKETILWQNIYPQWLRRNTRLWLVYVYNFLCQTNAILNMSPYIILHVCHALLIESVQIQGPPKFSTSPSRSQM